MNPHDVAVVEEYISEEPLYTDELDDLKDNQVMDAVEEYLSYVE